MDSIKQDLKVVEEEEDQYEKDMKLQVEKRVKQCLKLWTHTFFDKNILISFNLTFQPVKKTKSVDEDVVVATSMILMMAGYDTTATLLSYTSYALSKNPEVQTKLQEEVDEAFAGAEDEFPDYSVIQVHSKCRNRSKLLPPQNDYCINFHCSLTTW